MNHFERFRYLEREVERERRGFTGWLLSWAAWLHAIAITRYAEAMGYDAKRARAVADVMVADAYKATADSLSWENREADIQTTRLERRFDIGMALNEAANRAIGEKKTLEEHARESGLTSKQIAALKVQQQTLARSVRNA